MKLHVGDEFRDPAPAQAKASSRDRPCYRVTGVVRESAWFGLYEGKKVFTNFHFGRRELEETGDEESLDVLLKTILYPDLSSRDSVKELREQFSFECSRVLGRARRSRQPLSNLLPEPIDYLQVQNERDAFTFGNPRQTALYEPILVIERVRGLPLDRWLAEKKPTPSRILRVLASLLELLDSAHAEGLLLSGLAPAEVWVADDGRPHFLGSGFVLDSARQQKQRKLYPPERYAVGFGAPELYAEGQAIDARADLYSWAALAYFLLARDDLGLMAKAQGERFVRLDDNQLAAVEPALRSLTPADVTRIGQLFRFSGSRFAHTWPDGFINLLRECLRPDSDQRPASRDALAALWSSARPRPVPAALAIHKGRQVSILIASRDLEPGLEMVVRRGAGFVPRTPDEGQPIAQGAMATRAVDRNPLPESSAGPVSYAVFARVRTDGEPIFSDAAEAPLLSVGRPDLLISFAEQVAASDSSEWPPAVALLEELADANPVARAWLGSSSVVVRRWAVRLLISQLRDRKTRDEAQQLLLTRGLADVDASVRQAAVRALLAGERPDADLVLRVVTALSGGSLDAALAAARGLADVAPTIVGEVVRRLEGERPVACPVCQLAVRGAGLNDHLIQKHGYVDVEGSLLSYAEALKQLWRRLLAEQQAPAAAQLVNLLVDRHADKAETMFRNAFEAQLTLHAAALGPFDVINPTQPWRQLAACLSAHELTQRVCAALLTSSDERLRGLARLALLPAAAKRLTGKADVSAFLASLDVLCPIDGPDVRLAVVQQLADAGASKKAAKEAATELQHKREVTCDQCGAVMRGSNEASHLRREHGVYLIDGVRCSWDEALARSLAAALADKPDRKAAERYVDFASDRLNADETAARLTADLVREASASADVQLSAIAKLPLAGEVFSRLVGDNHHLALALFVALGKDASLTVLERAVPLINAPTTAEEDRRRAASLILSSRNAEAGTRERALDAYLAGQSDPLVILGLLKDLHAAAGKNAAVEARRRLLDGTTLPCPSCKAVLNLKQLEEHAWEEHGLVLQRGRWQSMWDAIAWLLDEFSSGGDELMILQAVALAMLSGEKDAPQRLAWLAFAKGIRHPALPEAKMPRGAVLGCLAVIVVAILGLVALMVWLLR